MYFESYDKMLYYLQPQFTAYLIRVTVRFFEVRLLPAHRVGEPTVKRRFADGR